MMVLVLKKAPARLRGELTRWLVEPRPGVFVGHVSAMVRDKLWEKCCEKNPEGGVLQMWNTNTEQHFTMRIFGDTGCTIIDLDGVKLVRTP